MKRKISRMDSSRDRRKEPAKKARRCLCHRSKLGGFSMDLNSTVNIVSRWARRALLCRRTARDELGDASAHERVRKSKGQKKPEIRSPKAERSPKPEGRRPKEIRKPKSESKKT